MLPPEKDERDDTSPGTPEETPGTAGKGAKSRPKSSAGARRTAKEPVSPAAEGDDASTSGPPADAAGADRDAEGSGPRDEFGAGESGPGRSEPVLVGPAEPGAVSPPPRAERSGGGFWTALVAAIVGGLVGAAGLWYWLERQDPPGPDPEILTRLEQQQSDAAAQSDRIAAIEGDIGSLNEALSNTDISDAVDQLRQEAEGRLEGVSQSLTEATGRLDAIDQRLDRQAGRLAELEARPVADPETATEVLRSEVAEMRAEVEAATEAARSQVETMRGELAGAAEETQARILEAEERAAELDAQAQERLRAAEAEAEARARAAEVQAALAQVEVALDSGAAYGAELATLAGNLEGEVPEALAAPAESGVPTLGELRESYPDAARAALSATAVATTEGNPGERFVAFLRNQTQARSLTPQEGDNPDAILSRADAALDGGDVTGALAELEALPEEGREAMQDWIDAARTRTEAAEAARSLSQQMN